MALNPEFERKPDSTARTNLRSEATLRRLLKEGRYPGMSAYYGDEQLEKVICVIPAGKLKPSETFTVSFEEAREIAVIRNKLQHQKH